MCPQLIKMVSKCKGGNFLLCRLNIDVCMRKYVWSWLLLYPYRCSKHFPFPIFHLSWWYDSISIKRRMRGVNLGRKMIILIHVTILWWIFFSNLLSNYVHQLVMHLALMLLENFLNVIYSIQWHLYMQLCTMSNNIQNEMFLGYNVYDGVIYF